MPTSEEPECLCLNGHIFLRSDKCFSFFPCCCVWLLWQKPCKGLILAYSSRGQAGKSSPGTLHHIHNQKTGSGECMLSAHLFSPNSLPKGWPGPLLWWILPHQLNTEDNIQAWWGQFPKWSRLCPANNPRGPSQWPSCMYQPFRRPMYNEKSKVR